MGPCSGVDTAGNVFDERLQEKRLKFDSEPASLWAGLQPDALGVVLRFLPSKADRSRLRSVCRNWRTAARGHAGPPPLPLLVFPRFRFSSLSPRGMLTAPRRAWLPPEVAGDNVSCMGTSGDWLLGSCQAYGEFLVHAFSHKLINLPPLSGSGYNCSMYSLHKVAVSAPPDSELELCIVAAFGFRGLTAELSLWRPRMKSWHVCRHDLITGNIDTAFYQGKLYTLWRFTPCLVAIELGAHEHGVNVTRIEDCFIEKHLPLRFHDTVSCNMVVWRGKLLLIIRYYAYSGLLARHTLLKVEVLALDFSTKPYGVTRIHSIGTDCIFVGTGGCKAFPAGLYDGFEDGLIYFVPDQCDPRDAFVYNMKDGKIKSFAFEQHPVNFSTLEVGLGVPVWLFPSE